mmetsp:Transcript_11033/g.19952  ORF Transcript_11033/g.19952 Transcript_11033/m.19952 type:complete len:370 (+) Transcript_11033:1541-2650(+)
MGSDEEDGGESGRRGCCGGGKSHKRKDEEANIEDGDEENVRCYKFRQQELWAITPILSPRFVISMYFVMSVIFLVLGGVMVAENGNLYVSNEIRYDNLDACDVGDVFTSTRICTVSFTIDETVASPSYLYYGMTNYYQNFREYAQSRSSQQLMGEWPLSKAELDTCDPLLFNSSTGEPIPCGLTAWSVFNDTFTLCTSADCSIDSLINTTTTGIAWDSDVNDKFLPGPTAAEGGPWTDADNALITSEPFMVWMRLSAFPEFIKLAQIIQEPLEPGTYYIQITNNYPVSSYDGSKYLQLTTVSWFGGKNDFLAISYLVTGGICLVLAIAFLVRHLIKPRVHAGEDFDALRAKLELLSKGESIPESEPTLT